MTVQRVRILDLPCSQDEVYNSIAEMTWAIRAGSSAPSSNLQSRFTYPARDRGRSSADTLYLQPCCRESAVHWRLDRPALEIRPFVVFMPRDKMTLRSGKTSNEYNDKPQELNRPNSTKISSVGEDSVIGLGSRSAMGAREASDDGGS